MTKDEYLTLAAAKWEAMDSLKTETDFREYERGFVEIWTELGRSVLEKSISEVPQDRRKKKKLSSSTERSK